MNPSKVSAELRRIASVPSSSIVDDLKKVLAAIDPTPEEQLIAEIHEDKSEQLKQLALQQLADTEGLKSQLLSSLNSKLANTDWELDKDPDGWSAWKGMSLEANGVSIPVTVSVASLGATIVFGNKSWGNLVEVDELPAGLTEAGISEDEFQEFVEAYAKEYEQFDWDPVLEWLADHSDAEDSGKDFMHDEANEEPTYGYYDLRGRG